MVGWSASQAMPLFAYQNAVMDAYSGAHGRHPRGWDAVRFTAQALQRFTRNRADLGTLSSLAIAKARGDRAEVERLVFEDGAVRRACASMLALEVQADEAVIAAVLAAGNDAVNQLSITTARGRPSKGHHRAGVSPYVDIK